MKLAVMQPYLFPYIGYFQLIHAVDSFVVYDDVNFINRGWINRNYFLQGGKACLFTLALQHASQNRLINAIDIGDNAPRLLKGFRLAYARAPMFDAVYPLLERVLLCEDKCLSHIADNALREVCHYLGLAPRWQLASDVMPRGDLHGQARILALCAELGASHYVNLPGGRSLYNTADFAAHGLELQFLVPGEVQYRQWGGDFVANLSIIDVLMFNTPGQCRVLLDKYSLATATQQVSCP